MLLPSAFRFAVRLALAAVVAVAAMPLTSGDADARRGVRAGVAGYRLMTRERNPDGSENAAASKSDAQPDDGAPPVESAAPAAPVATAAAKKLEDTTVPGCAPGMICTVCIAGCGSSNIIIVHAERRLTRQE